MIIVRTPLRVSFFGGGTDHPAWFKEHGPGAVLSTSIDKYVYVTLRHLPPVFDFNYRVVWREVEQVQEIGEIKNPVIREVLRHHTSPTDSGYEIAYNADLPARSGLGSSSAFTVAALHALWRNSGRTPSKLDLALEAIKVEQDYLGEPVGSQDQTAVAYGGFNRIDFAADGGLRVSPVSMSKSRKALLEEHIMMFFTGFTRDAGTVEKQKVLNLGSKLKELNFMYEMVAEGRKILENPTSPLSEFGDLLNEGWIAKKSLAKGVSNGLIDDAYDAAMKAGALGGKLLGAGGGGFLLFFVPPERQASVAAVMRGFEFRPGLCGVHVPLAFEDGGSSVVLHRPELNENFTPVAIQDRPLVRLAATA